MATQTLDKAAQTEFSIHPLLANRWSPKAFSSKAIPKDVIGSLMEAVRWTASSRNEQPWSFIIATKDNPAAFEKMTSVLKEGNQRWATEAPLLMLTVAHDAHSRPIALHDLGLAVQSLTVQAMANDLYLRQMGGIYPEKAHELYNVPKEHSVVTALAIGYLGNPNDLPDDLREREFVARERKPLASFVFEGEWGHTSNIVKS